MGWHNSAVINLALGSEAIFLEVSERLAPAVRVYGGLDQSGALNHCPTLGHQLFGPPRGDVLLRFSPHFRQQI